MRGLKYGFSFFCNDLRSNLIIALEIALLLIATNALLGFYNNLSVLYVPYQDILENDGVLYFDNSYAFDPEAAIEKKQLFDNLGQLEGNVSFYYSYTYPCFDENKSAQVIHIIDDRIYDRLEYATSSGSIKNGCALASYLSGYMPGDKVETEKDSIEISGVLTENTYFPIINGCEDCDGLHCSFSSGVDETEFLIMSLSSAEKLYGKLDPFLLSDTVMISFADCTDEQTQHNYNYLKERGQVWAFDKINTRSITKLKEQYARFVPFIVIIGVAVIIGIISFCIVTSLDNKNDMNILYNCGADSGDLFFIILGKNLCIILTAIMISALLTFALKASGILASNGITLKENLLPCSIIIVAACVVMCQLVSVLSNLSLRRKVK